jgi:hypothetical protein
MALARTNLVGEVRPASGGNFGTGSYSPPAITPPDSSLVVAAVALIENGGGTNPAADITISDTGGHTWTSRFALNTSGGFATALALYTAPVSTGSATTVTLTCNGRNIGIWASSIVAYTGYDTATPIGATVSLISNGAGGGPPNPVSMTLSGAPATTSEVFAAVAADRSTAGVTPGSTWTEIDDVSNPTASTGGGLETEVRTGSTSTTVDWVDIRPGGGALFNYLALAVEIRAATASTVQTGAFLQFF